MYQQLFSRAYKSNCGGLSTKQEVLPNKSNPPTPQNISTKFQVITSKHKSHWPIQKESLSCFSMRKITFGFYPLLPHQRYTWYTQ